MNKRLFIIEDDANILYGLAAKFRIEGFQVGSDNGGNDLETLKTKLRIFKPDYVVLDLVLPTLESEKLLTALKSEEELNRPCVFIFTNLSDNDSRERNEKLGADFYFLKNDFALDDFVAKIKKIIENREK